MIHTDLPTHLSNCQLWDLYCSHEDRSITGDEDDDDNHDYKKTECKADGQRYLLLIARVAA